MKIYIYVPKNWESDPTTKSKVEKALLEFGDDLEIRIECDKGKNIEQRINSKLNG
jgi:hypothetical protein